MLKGYSVGEQYGMLKIMTICGNDSSGRITGICRCACGNEKQLPLCNVVSGRIKSCGCLKHGHPHNFKTGESKTRLYRIWEGICARCTKPSQKSYRDYGARGISICDSWEKYDAFKKWAISSGYKNPLTIERVNVNDGYGPDNCIWISKGEQQLNKRNNHMINHNGVTKCLKLWANDIGLSSGALHGRLKRGWDINRALTEKPNKQYAIRSRTPADIEAARKEHK